MRRLSSSSGRAEGWLMWKPNHLIQISPRPLRHQDSRRLVLGHACLVTEQSNGKQVAQQWVPIVLCSGWKGLWVSSMQSDYLSTRGESTCTEMFALCTSVHHFERVSWDFKARWGLQMQCSVFWPLSRHSQRPARKPGCSCRGPVSCDGGFALTSTTANNKSPTKEPALDATNLKELGTGVSASCSLPHSQCLRR
ncbi:uncharacterized protein EI97DRAFT_245693 [Westerdykella ornata]|uniref:Uncharacterized protein n=1 Tax=Westerdykella ornata TaxID=318751 RepID=A0A6A6JPR6_WESOR|nr:uncharacterized protein EI97DRAFT_245693 [Westerdykella ornata]KAF2278123.1 hypothetical protein EI97DRAFT_245693 [Westerdykella ornata]